MNLLVITQKIDKDDDVLGFFHDWIEKFAQRAEKIIVIAQFVGGYDLPENVEVLSLGKERRYFKIHQLFNFYKLLFKNLSKADAVFVHMIPLWVVLGAPFYKIFRKKVYLWYTHKSVTFALKLAEKIVDKIFTASKESFRLVSDKVVIVGHGIDIEKFKVQSSKFEITNQNSKFIILTAGRIAPVKNHEILVRTAEILKNRGLNFEIKIAGVPILEQDKIYFEKLKNLIREKQLDEKIIFAGKIPHENIAKFYKNGDLFVNFSDTGSLDKAILEAMSAGLLVLTSNEAFKDILPEKYFTSKNPAEIAEKIILLSYSENDGWLREYVLKNHNLERLIGKLVKFFKNEQ